jgi:hypothetical protein
MARLLLMLAAIALVSCSGGSSRPTKSNTPVLKIAVLSDGRLMVEGQPSTIPQLREALQKLSKEHGAVWYYRQDGLHDPPPIVKDVLKEVVALRLPIRLSTKPDYSDSLAPPKR